MVENKKRILIIEDEKPMALALQLKLTKVGFEVVVANNGAEGLAIIKQAPVDIILTDLMMPELDGFGVLKFLQDQHDQTPVLVLSNLSQAEDEDLARTLGAKGFFVKSNTSIADIVESVQTFLK